MPDDYDAADHRGGHAALQFFICASVVLIIAATVVSIHGDFFPGDAAAESIDDQLNRMQSESDRDAHEAAANTPGSWRLGDGIKSGDSFTYRVCHSLHAMQFAHPYDCYTVRADFIYRTIHHAYGDAGVSGGLIWIVDASFSTADGRDRRTVLFVDERMGVHATSQHDRPLAESLENTLMHLSAYGEQNLSVGSQWGNIKTHFTSVPLSVISWDGDRTAVLGYDVGEHESRTAIAADLPFPTYGKWYEPNDALPSTPRILHEYVMLGRE